MPTTFVIPCYQEAEALDAGLAALLTLPADEFVFVDDGSTDGTAARLSTAAAKDARVRVVTHARNHGVGAAMRSGFQASTGDVVVAYDADRTYPGEDAGRLVAAVRAGADVAMATPFAPGGAIRAPWFRRVLSRGASGAYRLAIGSRAGGVRTFTGGFRAYRGALVRQVLFRSDGFASTAEVLCLLLLKGARVVEIASTLTARTEGRSKMRVGRTMLGHLRVLARVLDVRLGAKVTRP